MRILGVGLSRTGTTSLHRALGILGFKSLHYDQSRLNDVLDGSNPNPDFRRYDDVDAVTDIPTAWFYDELLSAYPDCRCVLTVRDEDAWWRSVQAHFQKPWQPEKDPFKVRLRTYVYGSLTPHEFLFRKRYREHNDRVRRVVPPDKLLVMNIPAGDGWTVLCPFLGVPVPAAPFPQHDRSLAVGVDHVGLAIQEIERVVPPGHVAVVADLGWLSQREFRDRGRMRFLAHNGRDGGSPPDDDIAIRELERLRGEGATFFVLGAPALWWLDTYWRWHHHLRSQYHSVIENERLVVFDLRP